MAAQLATAGQGAPGAVMTAGLRGWILGSAAFAGGLE